MNTLWEDNFVSNKSCKLKFNILSSYMTNSKHKWIKKQNKRWISRIRKIEVSYMGEGPKDGSGRGNERGIKTN